MKKYAYIVIKHDKWPTGNNTTQVLATFRKLEEAITFVNERFDELCLDLCKNNSSERTEGGYKFYSGFCADTTGDYDYCRQVSWGFEQGYTTLYISEYWLQ